MNTIISSLTENLFAHVIGLESSRETWLTLESLLSSQSQARIIQTRLQLSTLKKGATPVSEYFHKEQALGHSLAAINKPLQESELVSYILAGLGAEYDSLVTSITTRIDPISIDDLYGHLLSYDLCFEQHQSAVDVSILIANVAQRNHAMSPRFSRGQAFQTGYRNNHAGHGRG
jgi:hypothetical protein